MGVQREGPGAISLGVRTEDNRANRADFSSAPHAGSNEAEDCVAFERRQSPRIRRANGPRARCEVIVKRRDSRQLSSSLGCRLDPEQYAPMIPDLFLPF